MYALCGQILISKRPGEELGINCTERGGGWMESTYMDHWTETREKTMAKSELTSLAVAVTGFTQEKKKKLVVRG